MTEMKEFQNSTEERKLRDLVAPFVGLFKSKKSKDYYPRAKDCIDFQSTSGSSVRHKELWPLCPPDIKWFSFDTFGYKKI